MNEVQQWHTAKRVERTVNALKENGFEAVYASTRTDALQEVLNRVPTDALVGVGGSITVRELGLIDALNQRGHQVAEHWSSDLSPDERMAIRRQQLTSDVFLTSSNAITESGHLVNVDGAGNRVAAMIFGPKKVIVVAGVNKIVKNLEAALDRVNNVAAPMNAKRLNRKTPCAVTGQCTDCRSPERICNVTTIINRKPGRTDVTVLLVGEELGY
ncbi:MAG: lactate utilization protein [Candidatus Bathyarchaeota archaeon]|nr:lactate utilization protein [Candidatus Bathyarchaeota archaeon]